MLDRVLLIVILDGAQDKRLRHNMIAAIKAVDMAIAASANALILTHGHRVVRPPCR